MVGDSAAPGVAEPLFPALADCGQQEHIASKTRWWILLTFAALSSLQACTWNFYGPISDQIVTLEGWTLNQIAWAENTANIMMLFSLPLAAVFVQRKGLRLPTLVCALLMLLCTCLRCVPSGRSGALLGYVVALISMGCNGAAAAWMNFAGPVLSAAWFPASERGVATAIVSVAPFVGQSFGFLLGPRAVPSGADSAKGLWWLCFWEGLSSVIVFLAIVLHFPARPRVAPSLTASTPHGADAGHGPVPAQKWFRLGFVIVVSAVPNGVFGGWVPVLTPNLAEFGVSEVNAGYVGCLTTLLGAVGGLLFGWLLDIWPSRLKEMLIVCLIFSALCFGWFAVVATGALAGGAISLCIAGAVGGFFVNALFPLGFELAMETAYPDIPETTAAASISFLNTFVQIVFLALSFVSPLSTGPQSSAWMNWLNMFASAFFILPLLLFQARYPRRAADGVVLSLQQ